MPDTLSRLMKAIAWTPRLLFVWLLLCFIHDEYRAAPPRSRAPRPSRAMPVRADLTTADRITLQ